MTAQMTTLTCGDSTISSPDKALVLQFANFVLGAAPVESLGTCGSTIAVPSIGSYWAGQGGVYAGVMRGEDGKPDYHLIVPDVKGVKLAYGGYEKESSGCSSLRDGLANTNALTDDDEDHPAAKYCERLSADGHSDLYLPAINELALCMANVPEMFEKEWHWSSTQRSAYFAFGMNFDDGFQDDSAKVSELRVRPVRRLII
ncbi:DUF1566 domain-containing protein [Pseudomonas sp. SDO55104_S430]